MHQNYGEILLGEREMVDGLAANRPLPVSKKILYVYSGKARPNSGGLDLVVRQQIQALIEAGHRVIFVARGKYEHPQVTNICIRVTPANLISFLPSRYYYNAQHRFFSMLGAFVVKLKRVDIAMSWVKQGRWLFKVANKSGVWCVLNCPTVHYKSTDLEDYPGDFSWPYTGVSYFSDEYESSNIILTASEYARETFYTNGYSKNKVISIGRGADTQRFFWAEKQAKPFRTIFFGRASDRKGIFQAIDAWKLAGIINGELWIVGDVPKEIKEKVAHVLPNNAKLFGHRNDPENYLSQCHVQILPTRLEGMAKSLIEGAASGLVTITTKESGFPVIEGETGYYVDRNDIKSMAGHLLNLSMDFDRLHDMCKKSSKYACAQFEWAAFRERFLNALCI